MARLALFPRLGFTFMEVNGHQNYRDWEEQISHHPMPVDGVYRLPDTFYTLSGGVLKTAPYYLNLVDPTATASG